MTGRAAASAIVRRIAALAILAGLVAACGTTPGVEPAQASRTPEQIVTAEIEGDGGGVAGTLGSYTFDGRGSDSPWPAFGSLPGLTVPPSQPLIIRFGDGAAIGGWSAGIAAWDDATGAAVSDAGYRDDGPATAQIEIEPLPTGRWVLIARLFRADGRGDGVTYWAITVR